MHIHPDPSGPHDEDWRSDWEEQPWSPPRLNRLTHLVLVDGRLVDTWTEPVEGSRWQRYADEFDREKWRDPVVATPRKAPYDEMLDWLDNLLGGRRIVEALTTDPLVEEDLPDLPLDKLDIRARHRLAAIADLIDAAGEECFGPEATIALRRGLLLALEGEPEIVVNGKSAAHTAAGLCWAVGKANGLFGSTGVVTQSRVQEALALSSPLSGSGPSIQRALQGFLPRDVRRPGTGPDLLPLGHPGLLTSSTRRMLVRLRDRALAAKRDHDVSEAIPREG